MPFAGVKGSEMEENPAKRNHREHENSQDANSSLVLPGQIEERRCHENWIDPATDNERGKRERPTLKGPPGHATSTQLQWINERKAGAIYAK